jgi:peptide/nickel transport system ATP-binding protein/oligopeptide transport system ATP-binding protein
MTSGLDIRAESVTVADAVLSVRHLTTVFPAHKGIAAVVNGVSFDVYAGRTLGIVGESGSGKSMACRSIIRLVPEPGATVFGTVLFEGRDLLQLAEAELRAIRGREIGMVFQDATASLNPVFSVGDQLLELLRLHRSLSGRTARAEAVRLLDRVGIASASERLRAYPGELSGGMRQRVMIAIAIACEPKLLIADEPTTALDVTIQDQILSLILEIQNEYQMAVLLVSHDLAVIAETCDDVIVMYAGYVVERASVARLFSSPRHPYTAALLEALPSATERSDLRSIPGQPPRIDELPAGCPFRPRCRYADRECERVPMDLIPADAQHLTACPFHRRLGDP